jgi:hypothetical protein
MRPRLRRPDLVVWSSSGRYGSPGSTRRTRGRRFRRRVRTWALLAAIGLIRLARTVRARWRAVLVLAGAGLVLAGVMLPSGLAFIVGTLVVLRGTAVALGVSEPRRRCDGAPAGGADFFGFGSPAGTLRRRPGGP